MRQNMTTAIAQQMDTTRMFKNDTSRVNQSAIASKLSPIAISNQNLVGNNGVVVNAQPNVQLREIPLVISLTLDNSGSITPTDFLAYDAYGFCEANGNLTVSAPTDGSSAVTAMKNSTIGNPMLISGFTYESAVSALQLAQPFKVVRGDADGSYGAVPTILGAAIQNNQFTRDIQTFNKLVTVDPYTGILNTVRAGETVIMYLFINTIYNRLS